VASGLCVLIAVGTGVSGYLFSARPLAAHAQMAALEQPGAMSSQQVLNRVLKPWTNPEVVFPASAADVTAPVQPAAAPAQSVERAITVGGPGMAPPSDGSEDIVRAHREVPAGAIDLVPGDRTSVTLSFYYCEESAGGFPAGDGGGFCGRGRDGSPVRSGMAACDFAYLGQRFRISGDPTGRVYVCADTGSAVHGLHRDIWFLDNRSGWGWQSQVGVTATIEVLP
jgi:hypothetical protein